MWENGVCSFWPIELCQEKIVAVIEYRKFFPRTHFVTIVCFVGDSWIATWTALSIRESNRFRQNTGSIVRQFGMAESGSR